ncbi:uncharacterized protein LOC144100260 [Amblyomma americanum]
MKGRTLVAGALMAFALLLVAAIPEEDESTVQPAAASLATILEEVCPWSDLGRVKYVHRSTIEACHTGDSVTAFSTLRCLGEDDGGARRKKCEEARRARARRNRKNGCLPDLFPSVFLRTILVVVLQYALTRAQIQHEFQPFADVAMAPSILTVATSPERWTLSSSASRTMSASGWTCWKEAQVAAHNGAAELNCRAP